MQGVEAIGCEVIGLIPKQCILEAGHAYYRDKLSAVSNLEEDILEKGIAYLQLNAVKPFEPKEKILELNLAQHGLIM
jgi:glutamate formiminotransferase/formiminotetrahydrofolate cyclodeaminase